MPGRRPAPERDERGYSLVELSVAMLIASILMVAVALVVLSSTSVVRRTVGISHASDLSRAALNLVGKELPTARWVSQPGQVADRWYLEALMPPSSSSASPTCTQWRFVTDADELQVRGWSTVNPQPSAWRTLATRVVNDPAEPPFIVVPADGGVVRPQVLLTVSVEMPEVGVVSQQGAYTLRNPTTGAGPYCQEVGRP